MKIELQRNLIVSKLRIKGKSNGNDLLQHSSSVNCVWLETGVPLR